MSVLIVCLVAGLAGAPAPEIIDADTVWTAADSPWIVAGAVRVEAGAQLVIEPGVRVELAAGAELTIAGELVARGTADAPITFTGADTAEGKARWLSIRFEDESTDARFVALDEYASGSVLEHCVLEHGTRAVRTEASSPYIALSTFQFNETELSVDPAGGPAIYVGEGSAPRIVRCLFQDNRAELISWGGAIYAEHSSPIIADNTFINNEGSYGGAIATDTVGSPMVGNTFDGNTSVSEGGAVSLLSSTTAFLNNVVTGNDAFYDGGGVHVCRTCDPHAHPFFMDNTIVENVAGSEAGGLGAAFIRGLADNNIHDNKSGEGTMDFGWFNDFEGDYPDWVRHPALGRNWWGTADASVVDANIFDGADDEDMGTVSFAGHLDAPVTTPTPRVAIVTERIRYTLADEPMKVHLTLYNPGPERRVDLLVLVQYEDGPPTYFAGPIEGHDVVLADGVYTMTMPEGSVLFATITQPPFEAGRPATWAVWHALMTDHDSGERLGEQCSSRAELGEEAD